MPVGTTGALLAGRYRIRRRLGSGGMATVFLAEDERLGRQVAVKRLHADSAEDVAQRFQREAKLGASLNHPNIVGVYDTETDEEGVLIIMEFVDGETLREEIARGPMTPDRTIEVLRGVAAALDHAHDHGVTHRDIKPANVLISVAGTVKLADLGIATAAERTQITHSGTVLGTAAYMAPERLDGHAGGPEVDVYALAAVAFEALSGQKAITGKTALEVARRVISQPPPDLAQIVAETPPGAASALRRGLAKEPTERQHSAGELVRQLERAYAPAAPRRPAPQPPAVDSAPLASAGPPPSADAPVPSGVEASPAAAERATHVESEPPAPPDAAAERATHVESEPPAPPPPDAALARGAPVENEPLAPSPPDAVSAPPSRGKVQSERDEADPSRGSAAARPVRDERPTHRSNRRRLVPAALAAAALIAIALVVALGSGSTSKTSLGHSSAGNSASARHRGTAGAPGASPSSGAPAAPGASGSTPVASAPLDPSTPQGAVNSFYSLPTKGNYDGAWALATDALKSQVGGFASWKRGESDLKTISFPTLNFTQKSATTGTVSLVSAANHGSYTDHCTGTVDVVRGAKGWMLEQLHIADCPRTYNR